MTKTPHPSVERVRLGIVAAMLATLLPSMPAAAQTPTMVRFAYLKTIDLIPFIYAVKKGYLKNEGVEMELIPVQGGPAVAAAIASGSADIGYAAPTPIITARDQGQPYKFIFPVQWERTPDRLSGRMIASKRSGIKNFKDMAGKTILTGVPGGLCELSWRDWLAKNQIDWAAVKVLTNPFPQHQAMLEIGNADAACTLEPFFSSIKGSKVDPIVLGNGFLAEERRRYVIAGVFASDAWIKANANTIAAIRRALLSATRALGNDKGFTRDTLVEEFKLPPAVADSLAPQYDAELRLEAADLLPVVEAMKRYGMIKPGFAVGDVVLESR